jgi:hypothetical protein
MVGLLETELRERRDGIRRVRVPGSEQHLAGSLAKRSSTGRIRSPLSGERNYSITQIPGRAVEPRHLQHYHDGDCFPRTTLENCFSLTRNRLAAAKLRNPARGLAILATSALSLSLSLSRRPCAGPTPRLSLSRPQPAGTRGFSASAK